jgi:hypothetical protein
VDVGLLVDSIDLGGLLANRREKGSQNFDLKTLYYGGKASR